MNKTEAINLTFANDYVFFSVMKKHKDICKSIVEICLGRKVREIRYYSAQEEEKPSHSGKGIRMDVYLEDEDEKLYNVEMQATQKGFLGRRTRYYDSVMSINSLKVGQTYKMLPDAYVIFLCAFDPFHENRALYKFCSREEKNPQLLLEDGSYKILLNAYGDETGCSEEMKQLMAAVRGETISEDGLDRQIAEAVKQLAEDAQWRLEYMLYEINISESREEGLAAGIERGRTEGLSMGRMEGLTEGREQTLLEAVQNVRVKMGVSTEEAMDILNVSESEIVRLRELL